MHLAVTGHRPPRLGLSYRGTDRRALIDFAHARMADVLEGFAVERVYSGAAQGWDQAIIYAALRLRVPVTVAVPFEGQESRWPAEARREYEDLLSRCDVYQVCAGGYGGWKFAERDRWMVHQARVHEGLVLALFDGEPTGGTWITVACAQEWGVPVHNIWPEWRDFQAMRRIEEEQD